MNNRDPFVNVNTVGYGQSQAAAVDAGLRAYMLRIYNYMASALALTGIVALFAAQSEAFLSMMYVMQEGRAVGLTGFAYLIMFAPLIMVLGISFGINRMSAGTAQMLFWAYSVLMGLSLSSIFLAYTGESIARTFFITAGTFGAMSLYGYTTKRDLTGMGSLMMMGVIGLVLASIVNIFLGSTGLAFAISVVGVIVFTGLIAYDTQKLRDIYYNVSASGESLAKASIMGALDLYLDFINLFISLMRLMGERR